MGGATKDETATRSLTMAAAAIGRGDWQEAYDVLQDLDGAGCLDPEGLRLLADAAYGAGHFEVAIDSFERLHTACLDAGDQLAAASAATSVAMYLMMDTGLMAPVRGWSLRAARLLEGQEEAPVHAWLAMVRTYERLMSGDMEAASAFAQDAIRLGTQHGEAAPAAIGRIASARVRIFDGDVEAGLALLDEAAVAVVSGELDPLPTGMAYCELICAMQGLAQYDRAEEWTQAMERWRHGNAFGGINGRCRVHRAEILRLRGSCAEAEEEALHACEELRPWMRREFGWPLTELGTIRLRRGDLAGAEEAFLAAHEHGWDPQPGLALLRLAQGDVPGAVASIQGALDHPLDMPSKEHPPNGPLRRARLLEARAQIAATAGDVEGARLAADELGTIADAFRSRALQASAATARGHAAMADAGGVQALAAFEDAVSRWSEVGAPYETAAARLGLAEAHLAAGHAERAQLEFRAARAGFDRVGAIRLAREAARRCDPAPPTAADHARGPSDEPSGVFRLEGDTWLVGLDGQTVRLRDLKGLRYLARLLADPGREFHAMDLVAVEDGTLPTGSRPVDHDAVTGRPGDLGPILDDQAKRAYRRRLAEIDDDIEQAQRMGDLERAALAQADRDFIVRELTLAVGLGGRDRRPGSTAERARTSVTRSIRYAMARIAEHHAALSAHLDHAIRTGTYCAYEPDPQAPVTWDQ